MAKKNLTYRLTPAGREAWEAQDSALPADYRRILWLMDFHGQAGAMEDFLHRYPQSLVDDWLAEIHELGLIELVLDAPGVPDPKDPDKTWSGPQERRPAGAGAAVAAQSLQQTGAYLSTERINQRDPVRKPVDETVVLLVEDDPDQIALADLRLTMAGYKVRVADSVRAFLESMLEAGAPDVLVLDVSLPDGDGFEVLGKLRRHHVFGNLPVILLTAKNEAADIGRGLVLGADAYVTKPYTKKILAGVIRRVLKQGPKE
jgi:CheY-like chemotaxis protein